MAYNDYVVMIDENGQPYIAHGVFKTAAGKAKQGAKYLLKAIDTRTGLPVYAYTEQEVRRLQGMGRQAKKAVGNAASSAKNAVKDKLGYDERERYQNAKKRYQESAWDETGESGADVTARRGVMELRKAEYDRTALAKFEKLKSALGRRGAVAKDTIKRVGGVTLGAIRSGASRAGSAIRSGAEQIGNAVDSYNNKRNAKRANKAANKKGQSMTEHYASKAEAFAAARQEVSEAKANMARYTPGTQSYLDAKLEYDKARAKLDKLG